MKMKPILFSSLLAAVVFGRQISPAAAGPMDPLPQEAARRVESCVKEREPDVFSLGLSSVDGSATTLHVRQEYEGAHLKEVVVTTNVMCLNLASANNCRGTCVKVPDLLDRVVLRANPVGPDQGDRSIRSVYILGERVETEVDNSDFFFPKEVTRRKSGLVSASSEAVPPSRFSEAELRVRAVVMDCLLKERNAPVVPSVR